VNDVLDHARFASLPVVAVITAVNGVAEELFFRGALYAALGVRYAVAGSTLVYTATTVASGNAMLVFAAAVLGLLVGLERRVTGGVLAPVVTHVTWSLGMLFVLPPLMG
jgi:membrane protease YdiL (CAAX protease family)